MFFFYSKVCLTLSHSHVGDKKKSGPVWIKSVWVFAQLYKMLRDKYANISEWFSQTNLLRAGLSLRNLKNLFFLFTLLKHYQTPSRTQAQSNRDFCSLCDHLTIIYASVFFDVDFVYIFWKFYQQRGGGKSCVKWVRSSLPNARSSRERNWKTYFPSLIGLACRSLIGSFFLRYQDRHRTPTHHSGIRNQFIK